MTMIGQNNQDYKYVMDNLTKIDLGAKYSYREIIDNQDISYKFRNICRQCFEKEVSPDTTLESHLYYLRPQDESFEVYTKLRTKVTVVMLSGRQQRDGSPQYRQEVMKVQELALLSPEEKKRRGLQIQEIEVSKLGLLSFVI
jgi:hypothetical protein